MGRLIDADKVVEHLEKVKKESTSLVDMAHIIGFQRVIDTQPTAYDSDKVVAELERKKFIEQETILSDIHQGFNAGLSAAIHVVKGGGVE